MERCIDAFTAMFHFYTKPRLYRIKSASNKRHITILTLNGKYIATWGHNNG